MTPSTLARVGINEWERWVETDPRFVRLDNASELVGDAAKARRDLGWQITIGFTDGVGVISGSRY